MKDKGVFFSIIIVAYNAGRFLRKNLDSIRDQTCRDYEVIFVDNGSTDDTGILLRSYPEAKIIKNKENRGFCLANNQGIRAATGSHIITLNSDVTLRPDFLSELKKAAVSSRSGSFSPKILNKDKAVIDSTGLVLSGFYRFFDRGSGETDRGQYDADSDIFGPCAAAALYKKEMLEDIKHSGRYFDEDFFFLGEDFDLAWRARRKGWKSEFVPSAVCYHPRNSTAFDNRFRQCLSFRNRYFLLLKNDIPDIRYLPVFLLYDVPRVIYMLLVNPYTSKALYEIINYARRNRKGFIDDKTE